MHSIIIACRNRHAHLNLGVQALDAAAKGCNEPVELLISDSSETPSMIDAEAEHLLVRHYFDDPTPLFHKAKWLNSLAVEARGDVLTVLDVDCVCTPDFLASIERHFASSANKLGHRVLRMDQPTSRRFTSNAPGCGYDYLARLLAMNHTFPAEADTFCGITTGCGIFSMPTADFLALGGYCEDFIGYGFEDIEFNQRAAWKGIVTKMNTVAPLYHLHHTKGGWGDPAAELQNRSLFITRQQNGFPDLPPLKVARPVEAKCVCVRSRG